ncbi:MAG: DUF4830 domain-containing protein [Clostridia bacterium]|nr:DUF4830 domain-containing protein [Clostridia bacterium]
MFVFSLKANKKRLVIILAAIAAVLLIAFVVTNQESPVVNDGAISLKASNEEERLAFLSQFGWEVEEDPVKIEEVIIPTEFNEVYEKYNQLQLSQNFDLTKYAGETAKKWTYTIKNYPGYGADSDFIQANILVCEGAVIGGDVSSIEQNGFMRTFDFPEQGEQLVE